MLLFPNYCIFKLFYTQNMIKKIKTIIKSTDTFFNLLFITYIIIVIYSCIFHTKEIIRYSTYFLVAIYFILKRYWLKIDIKPNKNKKINQDFLNLLIFNISIIIIIIYYFVKSTNLSTNLMIIIYLLAIIIYIVLFLFTSRKYLRIINLKK